VVGNAVQTQNRHKIHPSKDKVGRPDFCKYPFSQIEGNKIWFHGKRVKKGKVYSYIKDLIDGGITSVAILSERVGKGRKQTGCYIRDMASLGIVKLNPETRMLLKESRSEYGWLSKDGFAMIPEISKWMDACISRQVAPQTMHQYLSNVRYMFNKIDASPKDAVSSKKNAIEFWTRFIVARRKESPDAGTHRFRISYKNFIASHDILFAPRMGKAYGLSSSHDNYGVYAGVSLSTDIISEIGKMILDDGDFELYVWWRIGLRTGGRKSAISTMMWSRVYFDETNEDGSESFKLEQHETKDSRGQYHIGANGEWKVKYPPLDLKKLLLEWKSRCDNPRFLWFRDGGSDLENRMRAKRIGTNMSRKLGTYYERVKDRVDPLTYQYMRRMPSHLMRHTLAQHMKDGGMTNEEIAESFGWRTADIVGIWYTKTSEKKRKELGLRASKVVF
ncbi:MAG: hypothetical protein ACRDFB_11155, partial [Rhabdochlamydiaceae bacterium]